MLMARTVIEPEVEVVPDHGNHSHGDEPAVRLQHSAEPRAAWKHDGTTVGQAVFQGAVNRSEEASVSYVIQWGE